MKAKQVKKRVKKTKTKKQIRNEEMTPTEIAMEDSEQYRGYHIETLKDDTVIVRRLAAKKVKKEGAVVYQIGEFINPEAAKLAIDKAAAKFGREINEFEEVVAPKKTATAKATKKTSTTTKSTKKQSSTAAPSNLNQQLRDSGLWQKGMQFLSSTEKQLFMDADGKSAAGLKKLQKILDDKLEAIAAKAKARG